jgi:hypothetical protein
MKSNGTFLQIHQRITLIPTPASSSAATVSAASQTAVNYAACSYAASSEPSVASAIHAKSVCPFSLPFSPMDCPRVHCPPSSDASSSMDFRPKPEPMDDQYYQSMTPGIQFGQPPPMFPPGSETDTLHRHTGHSLCVETLF